MAYIKYNDFEFPEEETRAWIDLTQQGERLIVVNGFIRVYSTGALRTALDEIIEGVREEYGKFYYGNRERYLNVIRREPVVYTKSYEPWFPFECAWGTRLQAEDPFWYAAAESHIAVQYTGKFNVEVGGNTEAYPYIRVGFTGVPAGGIDLKNNTTNKHVDYVREIADGDVLEIDMKKREIKKNGVIDLVETEDEGYFALQPGSNEIELDRLPADCDLTITFRDRWK